MLLHNDDIHTFEYVTNCLVKAGTSLRVNEAVDAGRWCSISHVEKPTVSPGRIVPYIS